MAAKFAAHTSWQLTDVVNTDYEIRRLLSEIRAHVLTTEFRKLS